jgi:hypothetical protein
MAYMGISASTFTTTPIITSRLRQQETTKYFYAPITLLEHKGTTSSFNNVTKKGGNTFLTPLVAPKSRKYFFSFSTITNLKYFWTSGFANEKCKIQLI